MAMTAPADVRKDPAADTHAPPMSHRQILEALSGLMLGMFVAILSSTIVSTALPEIIHDLDGGQSAYTWVVTASLLAMTATTPLWGKLADLTSKKTLVQLALILYVLASAGAGLAQNTGVLITFRAVQGIGVGGLSALAQVIMAAMISPRERGRYSGYLGATFAVATVGGPLLGGVITDTEWLGWRWCFYVGVPFAVVALIMLQKTLKLPVTKRRVKVDWTGAFLVSAAVSLLLIWVTLAGDRYAWVSWQSYAMVGGSAVLTLLFLVVESRASEPIIPLRLFRNRTITLTSLASMFVGIAMFGATVFLSQYFQLARGESPTMAGVMTIPLIGGLFVSSTVSGLTITRTGRWKAWLVAGGVLVTAGLGLLGTMRHDTEYWHLAVFMGLLGLGIGMMMQNLVLATQNQVSPQDLGAASSVVTFFRSLGGAVGVSALGAVLGHRVKDYVADGMAALGVPPGGSSGGGNVIPDPDRLPAPVRTVIEDAYGHGIGDIYLYAAPVALLALLFVLFVKEVPLRTHRPGESGDDGATTPKADGAAEPPAVESPADVSGEDTGTPRTGTGVRGFVRDAGGAAVPRAAVTLISLGGRQLGRSIARPDGAYTLDVPDPGSYVLIAAADGHQPQASTVVVGDAPLAHDVLLAGTSSLDVTVRDAAGGEPVAGALVVVTDARGEVLATGHTDGSGEAGFADLVPGTFTVAVDAAGFRPAAHPVEVGGRGSTRAGIELEPGALVEGVVRAGSERNPLPGARVTLVDSAGNVVATATTGEDGAYAFPGLDTGDYTVVASGYPPAATPLAVAGRGAGRHDIELAHPGE